jgi:hypothetical protein
VTSPAEGDDWIVLMRSGERLDPHALAWMAEAAAPQAPALLYWDEDRITSSHDLGGIVERHHDPVLRCRFDADSMLELNVIGTSFAARRRHLDAALALLVQHPAEGSRHPLAPALRERLVWALHRQGSCLHLPHVLLSRADQAADRATPAPPGYSPRAASRIRWPRCCRAPGSTGPGACPTRSPRAWASRCCAGDRSAPTPCSAC